MVRVAIVGVGNCASALVQGVYYYRQNLIPGINGLMTESIGGLTVHDVEFVAAFDVNPTKVGRDLSHAIFAEPNNTVRMNADVPYLDVTVVAGDVLDGIGRSAGTRVETVGPNTNIVDHLKATKTDVLVNYLPVGSTEASQFYATCAAEAGCGFVNAIPTMIARNPFYRELYQARGLPLIGDDIKSQVGATIVHRALAQVFSDRGVKLANTYQLNVGGNMDFLNMLDRDRLADKKVSKSTAVTSIANRGDGLDEGHVHIGPSDFVPFLEDRKLAFIRLEGEAFGGAPLSIEMRMEVWDSPNSAGIVIDAVRYAKAAMQAGVGGVLESPSAWLMKAPPTPMPDDAALRLLQSEYQLG